MVQQAEVQEELSSPEASLALEEGEGPRCQAPAIGVGLISNRWKVKQGEKVGPQYSSSCFR